MDNDAYPAGTGTVDHNVRALTFGLSADCDYDTLLGTLPENPGEIGSGVAFSDGAGAHLAVFWYGRYSRPGRDTEPEQRSIATAKPRPDPDEVAHPHLRQGSHSPQQHPHIPTNPQRSRAHALPFARNRLVYAPMHRHSFFPELVRQSAPRRPTSLACLIVGGEPSTRLSPTHWCSSHATMRSSSS